MAKLSDAGKNKPAKNVRRREKFLRILPFLISFARWFRAFFLLLLVETEGKEGYESDTQEHQPNPV
jgi:hypothetical protein